MSDPPHEEKLSDLTFSRPIPRAVRDFGKALDPKLLQPGDLLLFSDTQRAWPGRQIVRDQARQFADKDACWHHVAVSGGKFEICEATLTGVKCREYWAYMTGRYELKLRRLKKATAEERNLVAYYAATNAGTGYGFANLPGLSRALSNGNFWTPARFSSGLICSQLYFEACMRVGILLDTVPSHKVCPAHLSASTQMEDIPLAWVDI